MTLNASFDQAHLNVSFGNESLGVSTGTPVARNNVSGVNLPTGGYAGDLLAKRTNTDFDMEWITPATSAEQDNTRPITAGAVYTEIGNINALLATI